MINNTPNFTALHALFCHLTNREMAMAMGDMFRWEIWHSHGWTEADLCLVVAFINRRIKAQRRWPESLRLHNLIDPARFADDLQDARGEARIAPVTPRDKALAASGRSIPVKDNVRSTGQILAERAKMALMLRQFRENL